MIKPILFNTEMVQAIPDRRKKVTRRIIKPQPLKSQIHKLGYCVFGDKKDIGKFGFGSNEHGGNTTFVNAPYRVDDILYVRETFLVADGCAGEKYFYKADETAISKEARILYDYKWHPSIHMPKEAARIFLKVTDVKVERLDAMTLNDYLSEGITIREESSNDPENAFMQARNIFAKLWDSTVKEDYQKFNANPWVWVIEFKPCEKPEGWPE